MSSLLLKQIMLVSFVLRSTNSVCPCCFSTKNIGLLSKQDKQGSTCTAVALSMTSHQIQWGSFLTMCSAMELTMAFWVVASFAISSGMPIFLYSLLGTHPSGNISQVIYSTTQKVNKKFLRLILVVLFARVEPWSWCYSTFVELHVNAWDEHSIWCLIKCIWFRPWIQ